MEVLMDPRTDHPLTDPERVELVLTLSTDAPDTHRFEVDFETVALLWRWLRDENDGAFLLATGAGVFRLERDEVVRSAVNL
jgi:hypothetical protein